MRAPYAVLALLAGLSMTGCVSISGHFGSKIPVEHLSRIHAGETTREQIAAWFGPPSAFYNPTVFDLIFDDGEELATPERPILNDVYTYRYIENEARIFFFPVLFAFARGQALAETLIVFFDEDGRVEYHAYRRDVPPPDEH
jgi:outer membrane protein assembly factor BamE (lipoprotein component of BamABCDE complex)